MGFLTNWIFWVLLALIIFVLALIGYLSEGKKNKKNEEINDGQGDISILDVPTSANVAETVAPSLENTTTVDDWSVMPEAAKPLEPVNVQKIDEPSEVKEEVASKAEPIKTEGVVSETTPVVPLETKEEAPAIVETPTVEPIVTPAVESTPIAEPAQVESLSTPEVLEPAKVEEGTPLNDEKPAESLSAEPVVETSTTKVETLDAAPATPIEPTTEKTEEITVDKSVWG